MRLSKRRLKRVRPLLGTYVEIELCGAATEELLNTWITAGFEAVSEVDRLMSFHRLDSDLSRLNQTAPGAWVRVNRHTRAVLKASNDFYHVSQGVFDIRCAGRSRPTLSLKREGPRLNRKPSPFREKVPGDRMRAPVEIRGDFVCKTGPWTLDLGGIAKGYAVDHAMNTIRKISRPSRVSGVVNAGGDLRRWGSGAPPVAVATSSVRTLDLRERLSPATHINMPIGTVLRKSKTVSVLSNRCLWSDALTKVILMGSKQVTERCLSLYGAKGIILA